MRIDKQNKKIDDQNEIPNSTLQRN